MSIFSLRYKRGYRRVDNMGPEFTVLMPLLFGYYWCRQLGRKHGTLMHERDL